MSYVSLTDEQVAAKAPVDHDLMDTIKDDLDDLNARALAAGAFDYQFKLNGRLNLLSNRILPHIGFKRRMRVDGGLISKDTTFQSCKILIEEMYSGGTVEADIRAYSKPDAIITSVAALFKDTITSIGRVGSSLNTQSIARATPQISTQSISRYKSQGSIASIVVLGNGLMRVNLTGVTVDADWQAAAVTIASATAGGNNGTFTCIGVNMDGGNNVLLVNPSAVAQTSPAGTADSELWKYVYTNPVSSEFAAGENVVMASHTDSENNGTLYIFGVNLGGNNIVVAHFFDVGKAQAGAAGNANTCRLVYNLSAPAAADYVVGETILAASHTSGLNDGIKTITAVNSGGNNVVVYNPFGGATQGGAAGTIDTNRWTYAFAGDPSTGITAGDYVYVASTTSDNNEGPFVVKQVNRASGTNIIIHNSLGVAQGGSAGTATTHKKKVSFAANQTGITADSRIAIVGNIALPDDDYDVAEVNRGGGSNYNAVVSYAGATEQAGACGRVSLESKSIFDTRPSITVANGITDALPHGTHGLVSSNAVLNNTRKTVTAGTIVMMDVVGIPAGVSRNLTVQLL